VYHRWVNTPAAGGGGWANGVSLCGMVLGMKSRGKVAAGAQRAMIASAVLVKQSQLRAIPSQQAWQEAAWETYDRVGELRFAAQWMSNALSRCRLYVGVPDADGSSDPDPIDPADAATGNAQARVPLLDLFNGAHEQMLARLAIHLLIPGESYIVGLDIDGERKWIVASGDEFTKKGRVVKVRMPDTNEDVEVDVKNSTVIRIWRPHARRGWEADSPVRALLPVLQELLNLTAHITATVESRLAGAGILWMPEGTTLPKPVNSPNAQLHEDPSMATLIDAMVTPISMRDSASAVVPIIARIPDAVEGKTPAKPQFMSFATPLDAKVQELREAAIRRLATGLDMPPEILLGLAGTTSHWTAWQLEESAIKLHIEPLLALICSALTEKFLRPALIALEVPDADNYVIWFDASELALRPNRGPEAQALHEMLLVAGDTTRREAGFGDEDKPDDDEIKILFLRKLALAGVAPEIAAPYLRALGIPIILPAPAVPEPSGNGQPGVAEEPPPGSAPGADGSGQTGRPEIPGTPGAPGTAPPARTADPAAASVATAPAALTAAAGLERWPLHAVEMAVVQALDRAGKKMLSWNGRKWRGKIDCPGWEIHTRIPAADFDLDQLLDGAYACLDQVLGEDQPCVRSTVDTYVRTLLTGQRHHTRDALHTAMETAGCLYGGGGTGARAA